MVLLLMIVLILAGFVSRICSLVSGLVDRDLQQLEVGAVFAQALD